MLRVRDLSDLNVCRLSVAAHALCRATIFLALFTSLEQPSRQSMIPNLVPREQMAQALALQGTQRYVPVIAGPSIAGVVHALFGPAVCYAVDAFSWVAMLSALVLLRTRIAEGGGGNHIWIESYRPYEVLTYTCCGVAPKVAPVAAVVPISPVGHITQSLPRRRIILKYS
ncbi:MAG: MFS transporter [Deltaproteobacteria bacterium]|nr:MAG: MFS transporter [Deltaproteobacteria bacterium]